MTNRPHTENFSLARRFCSSWHLLTANCLPSGRARSPCWSLSLQVAVHRQLRGGGRIMWLSTDKRPSFLGPVCLHTRTYTHSHMQHSCCSCGAQVRLNLYQVGLQSQTPTNTFLTHGLLSPTEGVWECTLGAYALRHAHLLLLPSFVSGHGPNWGTKLSRHK